jgi:hypothetical protein
VITPPWLADAFAALVLAIAAFSAARLIAARSRRNQDEVDADGIHVLMGVAMAGMFVPRLATLPAPLWEAIFAAGAAWFGGRAVQVRRARLAGGPGRPEHLAAAHYCRYPVPHLIDCAAMLYMFWAVAAVRSASGAAAGMSGMAAGGARLPVLDLALALAICGYVVWMGDRFPLLSSPLPAGSATARPGPAGDLVTARPAAGSGQAGLADAAVLTGTSAAVVPAAGGGPVPPGAPATWPARTFLAPRTATCCKIAMGVAMGVMLVDLL